MIKIDMEMPKQCSECEYKFFDDLGYYHCCYTKRFCHSSKREEKCPLIECEDEIL